MPKPSQTQVPKDPRERHIWIVAALKLADSSFTQIATELGCSRQYVAQATTKNHRRAQEAIASKIGIPAADLFPEWFLPNGRRVGSDIPCHDNSGDKSRGHVESGMRA